MKERNPKLSSVLKVLRAVESGNNDCILTVSKETNMTYCYLWKLIMWLESVGLLIVSKKIGRSRRVSLTENGRMLLSSLKAIKV